MAEEDLYVLPPERPDHIDPSVWEMIRETIVKGKRYGDGFFCYPDAPDD